LDRNEGAGERPRPKILHGQWTGAGREALYVERDDFGAASEQGLQTAKTVQRNKLLFSGVGVIALLIVASLIVVSASLAKERRSRREAEEASAKSRQVTRFLEDMLQGVGPAAALAKTPECCEGLSIEPPNASARR